MKFEDEVRSFLGEAYRTGLRLIMVGGAAVNHHGYKRHSADVDLWIEPTSENFARLVAVLQTIGYEVEELPNAVLQGEQNISVKISPEQEIEVITRFEPGGTFEELWSRCVIVELAGVPVAKYRVIALDDLIESKLKAARPKDLLDVLELRRKREA